MKLKRYIPTRINLIRLFALFTLTSILVGYAVHIEFFKRPKWDIGGYWRAPIAIHPDFLWSYIPGVTDVGQPASTEQRLSWQWANTIRRQGYRRPSWGGLSEVGPKASLRTNLKPGMRYLTGSPMNGWNNQVAETMNALYIALKSGVIPVANAFYVHEGHMGRSDARPLAFTEVFDVSSLVKAWDGRPVIDAMELKVDDSTAIRHRSVVYDGEHPQRGPDGRWLSSGDTIEAENPIEDRVDCWSTGMVTGGLPYSESNVHEPIVHTYTPFPKETLPSNWLNCHSGPIMAKVINTFWAPGGALPIGTIQRLAEMNTTSRLSPTDIYTCIDRTFETCEDPTKQDMAQDWLEGVGAWKEVGTHMKFQPGIQRVADDFLRYIFGIGWKEPLPPYAGVHIRRGDMYDIIKAVTQRQWAWRSKQLLQKYESERGIRISHVVFTSDEQDETWLKELDLPGWYHVDHLKMQTNSKLGFWWPTVMDSAILSASSAFIGIASSSMSLLAAKRVEDANGMIDFIRGASDDEVPVDWKFEI